MVRLIWLDDALEMAQRSRPMMTRAVPLTSQLIAVADAYCAAAGRSRSRVSTIIFGGGDRLDGVASGKDLNTRSFERAMQWFSKYWPADTPWPEGIERPEAAPVAKHGAAA